MADIPEQWYFSEIGPFYQIVAEGNAPYLDDVLRTNEELKKFDFTKRLRCGFSYLWIGGIYVPGKSCLVQLVQGQRGPENLFTFINIRGVKRSLDDVLRLIEICEFKAEERDLSYVKEDPANFKNTAKTLMEQYGEEEAMVVITEGNKDVFELYKNHNGDFDPLGNSFGSYHSLN